jgi:hypothetical protein
MHSNLFSAVRERQRVGFQADLGVPANWQARRALCLDNTGCGVIAGAFPGHLSSGGRSEYLMSRNRVTPMMHAAA